MAHRARIRRSPLHRILAIAMLFPLLAACGGGSSSTPAPTASLDTVAATPFASPTPSSQAEAPPTRSESASAEVSAAQGGEVSIPDQIRVLLPPDALQSDARVEVSVVDPMEVPALFESSAEIPFRVFSIDASVDLTGDAHIEFAVDEPADDILVMHYDEQLDVWDAIDSAYDPERGVVTIATPHFSLFGWLTGRAIAEVVLGQVVDHWETLLKEPTKPRCAENNGPVQVAVEHTFKLVDACMTNTGAANPKLRLQNTSLWNLEFAQVPASNEVPITPISPGEWVEVKLGTAQTYPVYVLVGTQEYADVDFLLDFLGGFFPGGSVTTGPEKRAIVTATVQNLGTHYASVLGQLHRAYQEKDPVTMAVKMTELLLDRPFAEAYFKAVIEVAARDGGKAGLRMSVSALLAVVVEIVSTAVNWLVEAAINAVVHGLGLLHVLVAQMGVIATRVYPQIVISGLLPTPTPEPTPQVFLPEPPTAVTLRPLDMEWQYDPNAPLLGFRVHAALACHETYIIADLPPTARSLDIVLTDGHVIEGCLPSITPSYIGISAYNAAGESDISWSVMYPGPGTVDCQPMDRTEVLLNHHYVCITRASLDSGVSIFVGVMNISSKEHAITIAADSAQWLEDRGYDPCQRVAYSYASQYASEYMNQFGKVQLKPDRCFP